MSPAAVIVSALMLIASAMVTVPTYFFVHRRHLRAAVGAGLGMSLAGLSILLAAVTGIADDIIPVLAAAVLALAIHGVLMLLIVRSAMAVAAAEDAEQTF